MTLSPGVSQGIGGSEETIHPNAREHKLLTTGYSTVPGAAVNTPLGPNGT